jgi:hypothetical protein
MHFLPNRYLYSVFSRDGSGGLNSLLTTTTIPNRPTSTVSTKLGLHPNFEDKLRPAAIIGLNDSPVLLSRVKAGHLLSTVSQDVWLQGKGRRFTSSS